MDRWHGRDSHRAWRSWSDNGLFVKTADTDTETGSGTQIANAVAGIIDNDTITFGNR